MLIVGEVHTGLLRGRDPVADDVARALVDLVSGEPVLVSERPRSSVRSSGRPVGVDCPIDPGGSGRPVRGIGTVIQRATITDGHVLQGSAYTSLDSAAQSARRPWSHYLARPGVVETVGRTRWAELAGAFAAVRPAGFGLDLGAIAAQAADRVQGNVRDGGRPRLRAARTRLRWVVEVDATPAEVTPTQAAPTQAAPTQAAPTQAAPTQAAPIQAAPIRPAPTQAASGEAGNVPADVLFTVYGDQARVLRFPAHGAQAGRLAAIAEDVALHDWLLTALREVLRKAAIGVLPREEAIDRLLPAVDYLMHLWLPGGGGDDLSDRVWAALERRAGLSRQWDLLVNRIRDQLSVAAVAALSAAVRR